MRPPPDQYGDAALWKLRWSKQIEEARMWRNLVALMPYAVPVPRGELPSAYRPRLVQIPKQRSRTAAEAEDRLFNHWPGRRGRT